MTYYHCMLNNGMTCYHCVLNNDMTCYHCVFHNDPRMRMLGSIDANTGSPDLGWDTDQFPMDVKAATMIMKTVIEQVSRTSITYVSLFW